MRVNIELSTANANDVAILKAIANVCQYQGKELPAGLVIANSATDLAEANSPEPDVPADCVGTVAVHAPADKADEAIANCAMTDDVKQVEVHDTSADSKPDAEPEVRDVKPTVDPDEISKKLRQLLLDASSIEGVDIEDAKQVVADSAGVKVLKDMKPEQGPAAIKALEAFIASKSK